MRIIRENSFEVPMVDLAAGQLFVKQDYSIKEKVDDEVKRYGHDYIEELPYNWSEMNEYLGQRMKEKDKPADNVNRGVYGTVYDFFDAISELSDPTIHPESLQKLYQIGNGLLKRDTKAIDIKLIHKEKKVDVDDFEARLVQIKKEKKKSLILGLVTNMVNFRVYEMTKRELERPLDFVPIDYLSSDKQIKVEKIIDFLETILKTNFEQYVKDLTKMIWNRYILNGNLKKRLIDLKKHTNVKETEFFLYILWKYCPREIWNIQKRVISAIYCSYQENSVSNVLQIFKKRFLRQEWRTVSAKDLISILLDEMNLRAFEFKPIYHVLKRIFPKEFLKGSYEYPFEKLIVYPHISADYYKFTLDGDAKLEFGSWVKNVEVEFPSMDHLILYLFESRTSKSCRLNGSLLKFFLVPRKTIVKKCKDIIKNRILEFEKMISEDIYLDPFDMMHQFHSFLTRSHPRDQMFFSALFKRDLMDLSLPSRIFWIHRLEMCYFLFVTWMKYIVGLKKTSTLFIDLVFGKPNRI